MKEIIATVTQRAQVALPADVRRVLGIKPRDKVVFAIEGDQVRLVPARFTLESGYVTPRKRPEDFKRHIREAMEEHADEVVQEMQGR